MPERRTILVTDDSGANRDLLCGQLSTLGFWTEAATNGEEAVRAARRLMPDLILMDVEMPVMNGHDACKQLKADPATAEIPVLMMTGFDPRPERSKMVEAGGDDLIVKPIPMRDLQVRVRALLRLKELRRDLRSTQESLRELVKRENPTESKAPFDDSVALTAQALARLIGLDAEDQEVAFHAGLLHDIGQIGLSEELLNKQGSLTPEEFAQIKQHTILGAEIAGPFRPASVLAPAIRHQAAGPRDPDDGPHRRRCRRLPRDDHRPALPAATHRCQGARDPGGRFRRPVGPAAHRRLRHVISAAADRRHPGRRSQDRLKQFGRPEGRPNPWMNQRTTSCRCRLRCPGSCRARCPGAGQPCR